MKNKNFFLEHEALYIREKQEKRFSTQSSLKCLIANADYLKSKFNLCSHVNGNKNLSIYFFLEDKVFSYQKQRHLRSKSHMFKKSLGDIPNLKLKFRYFSAYAINPNLLNSCCCQLNVSKSTWVILRVVFVSRQL